MSNEEGTSLLKIIRPQQFRYGGDFKQFCSRFQQYVELGKIKDDDLNLIFLSMLDDRTYTKLSAIEIEEDDAKEAKNFCEIYLRAYYPSVNTANVASDMMKMTQGNFETIDDFSYRIDQKSARLNTADINLVKYTAFVNGLKNKNIQMELRKSIDFEQVKSYADVVNMAKNLESYDQTNTNYSGENYEINEINFRSKNRERRGNPAGTGQRQGKNFTSNYQSSNNIQCFKCSKFGHKQNQCRSRSSSHQNHANYGNSSQNSCKICGYNNHRTFECRHKGKGCTFCGKSNHIIQNCFRLKNKSVRKRVNKILAEIPDSNSDFDSESESSNIDLN
jgi:hypothetical protein